MAERAPTLSRLDYGGAETRPHRGWIATGVVAYAWAAVWLTFGVAAVPLAALEAVEVAWPARTPLPPPRPLTAAEADAVVSAVRSPVPLTPPQLDTLWRQVQLAGQRLVETRPGMPGLMDPPTIATGWPDGRIVADGKIDDCSTTLTIAPDGGVARSLTTTSISRDEMSTTQTDADGHTVVRAQGQHAYALPKRRLAAVAAVIVAFANVAAARHLLTLGRAVLRAPLTVRRLAVRFALLALFAVAALTAAAISEYLVVNLPAEGLSPFYRTVLQKIVGGSVVAGVFPVVLLVAVIRTRPRPHAETL